MTYAPPDPPDRADDTSPDANRSTEGDKKGKKGKKSKIGKVSEKHAKSEGVKSRYKDAEFHWKHLFTKRQWIPYWLVLIVLAVLVVLMTVYHKHIVNWLQPFSNRIRELSWGWVVPILILILLSFPPLFGHEIVIILCGIIWGLWKGFGIAAAGTFLGEICTYIAFRTFLYSRAVRMEQRSLNYGALALMTRRGGFLIVFIVRLSVIPSHFTTAVFAVCGVKFWIFAVASFITLPKQLIIVYLGVIFNNPSGGRRVSDIVLGITFLITLLCGAYIWWGMVRARRELIETAEREWEEERSKGGIGLENVGNAGGGNSPTQGGYHEAHPYYKAQQQTQGGSEHQTPVEYPQQAHYGGHGGEEPSRERIKAEANEIGLRGTQAEGDIEAQNRGRI